MKNSLTKSRRLAFAYARTAAELSEEKERTWFNIWNVASLLVSSAGITVLSLLLGLGMFELRLFFDYFTNPLFFLLNWIPVLLLQAFLYGLTRRHWIAFLITGVIVLGASAGSFYKLRFREEPLLFSDFFILGAALDVAGEFDLTPNTRLILTAVALPCGTLILFFFAKGRPALRTRLLLCLGSAVAAGLLWVTIYSDDDFYTNVAVNTNHIRAKLWNEQIFVSKGSVYPFLHSITYAIESPPEGYSEEETAEMLAAYPESEIPDDRRVHLLVFQLESFCDYTQFGIQGLQPGFYDYYHELEAESYTGDLIVDIIGGGTINTERCFLTGTTRLFTYSAPADSYVRLLREHGYTALSNHTHYGSFYSRTGVNAYLGFESFRCSNNYYEKLIEGIPDHWMTDAVLFPCVLDEFHEHAAQGETVFSFTVTTQGHGGYLAVPYEGPEVFWSAEGCSEDALTEVNTYFSKIADTQVQLAAMIDSLRYDPEPVAVLIYGDHQPRLSRCDEFYALAGLDFSAEKTDSMVDSYTTRYLIWVNEAARELLGSDLVGEGPTVSPTFLMDVVFEQLGWRGNAFMQLEREARSQISVINDNGFYLTSSSGVTSTLTDEEAALLRKLEYAQFYVRSTYRQTENDNENA